MGKPGPKPTPRHVKEMRGSRIRGNHSTALVVARAIPMKPPGLDPEVDALWEYYSKTLYAMGLLSANDGTAILRLAEATAEVNAMSIGLKKGGIVQVTPSGFSQLSPEYTARNHALAREYKLLCEFGLTPSARVRVVAIPQTEPIDVTESLMD